MPGRAAFLDLTSGTERTAWHNLIESAADATAFHLPAFVRAYEHSHDVRAAGVWNEGGQLVCGTWLFVRSGARAAVPPLCTYAAPLTRQPLRAADVHRRRTPLDVLLAFVQQHLRAAAFHLPPGVLDARPYQWAGFDLTVRYTYRLRVDEPETMRSRMSRVRRRALAPLEPEPASGSDLASAVSASYARQRHRLPLSAERLARAAAAWAAAFDARQAGGHALLAATHKRVGYDVLSGAHDAADAAGRTGLLWSLLADLRGRGVTLYDLCGANTPSIAEFKRTLGADLVPFYRATWHRPGLARTLGRLRPLV